MATPLPVRVVEHQAAIFRRFWRGSATFYVLNPVMFLAAIGFGLGGLVDERSGHVAGLPYDAFVAPGLMAAGAMLGAAAESLWPIMAGTKWVRTFHAMVATPVAAEPAVEKKPRRRGFGMFVLGFLLGAVALFGLALYAALRGL